MNRAASNIIIFSLGVISGGLASMKYFEAKYKAISDEEIASVKETFENLHKKYKEENREKTVEKPAISNYTSVIANNNYANPIFSYEESDEDEDDSDEEEVSYIPSHDEPDIVYEISKNSKPESIDPDNYGDIVGYDKIELTYYIDGVFADEEGNIIENVDEVIGLDNVDHFGEYATDALFIRNDSRSSYYEIYMDKRSYQEANGDE